MPSDQNPDREKLLSTLHDELADTETGPLGDTPYIAAEVESDGMLSLFESSSPFASFPAASVDVPQLADAIIASEWMREHNERVWNAGYTVGNAHNGRRDACPYRTREENHMSEPTRGPIGGSGASDVPNTGQAVKPDENGWGATFHRHFGSNEIHRDGGPECNQPGKPRPVYVFDPDYLAEHDERVRREAAAEQREIDARIAESVVVRTSYSARTDVAAAIREQGNDA